MHEDFERSGLMWEWFLSTGWYLLVVLVLGGYFVLYVAAVRHQRGGDPRRRKLPSDRC